MNTQLPKEWQEVLKEELAQSYYTELMNFITDEYDTKTCYPPKELIFNAFYQCSFKDVKVVIIGQDPYHGNGQANGLAFSVAPQVKIPPSLVNIFKEIKQDIPETYLSSGDLTNWAKQGILLLNDTLTVVEGKAGSHYKQDWKKFTNAVIKQINDQKTGVVFLLWGGFAHKKGKIINQEKHLVLTTGHPSPLSANQGKWFGNAHFSKTNDYLISKGFSPIDWSTQ